VCSDNDCPSGYTGSTIPRGSGYMYISRAVVEFRRDARAVREAEQKVALMQRRMNIVFDQNVVTSTLMCDQGARKRDLDLDVALPSPSTGGKQDWHRFGPHRLPAVWS